MSVKSDLDRVHAYHQRSKHQYHRMAPGPQGLDWDNQPVPFRHFAGATESRLDIDPDIPDPAFARAMVEGRVPVRPLDARSLSRFLFDSLALSAWKAVAGSKWSLRVNPSSGNLHPTEGWVLAGPLAGLSESAGVYHYCPDLHGLEQRAEIPPSLWSSLEELLPNGSFLVGLSSIPWREAWKYGERAFRYCQHDVGHAIAALSIGAAGLGWKALLLDRMGTDQVGWMLGLDSPKGPEAEHPDCLLVIHPQGSPCETSSIPADLARRFSDEIVFLGEPNRLSREHREWDAIDDALVSCRKPASEVESASTAASSGTARILDPEGVGLQHLVRQRRSGVAYDAKGEASADGFFRLMESVVPLPGSFPFNAFPYAPVIDLAVFVHRVEGLESGLYWLQRHPSRLDQMREALHPKFLWTRKDPIPEGLPLYLLASGDFRAHAMTLSCQQEIAGAGVFSLGMIADFESSLARRGAWYYPRLFFEAGAIGQRLYLESEAIGLRSTGIGCYFDDAMHELLGLSDARFQSMYHFATGKAVEDSRLQTLPAY